MLNLLKALIVIFVINIASLSNATEYWVSKTGSNTNNCSSQSLSCSSIQKGLNLLAPGDTLNIDEGLYIEDSTNSKLTSNCGLLDADYGSLCIKSSGTKDQPITIRALAGKEGRVVIDSEGKRAGLIISKYDYIHIKNLTFINNWSAGIGTPGGPAGVPNESFLSIGCVIEGNTIIDTSGAWGVNNSAIYMWSTKDWIVRNNVIKHVSGALHGTGSNGLQTYGTINALIENNTITEVDHGINWKDHYVTDTNTKGHFQESIIRNNWISADTAAVRFSIRADGSNPAGHNLIEGNIFELVNQYGVGVAGYLAGASSTSGNLEVKNNLFVGHSNGHIGINADSFESLRVIGNVFAGIETPIALRLQSTARAAFLTESNYNVFDTTSFQIQNDKYSSDEENYRTLSNWQAARPSQDTSIFSLRQDNPDKYSIQVDTRKILEKASNLYKDTVKSLLGPNGITYQPGPYQVPDQIIGASATLKSKPRPPKPL